MALRWVGIGSWTESFINNMANGSHRSQHRMRAARGGQELWLQTQVHLLVPNATWFPKAAVSRRSKWGHFTPRIVDWMK